MSYDEYTSAYFRNLRKYYTSAYLRNSRKFYWMSSWTKRWCRMINTHLHVLGIWENMIECLVEQKDDVEWRIHICTFEKFEKILLNDLLNKRMMSYDEYTSANLRNSRIYDGMYSWTSTTCKRLDVWLTGIKVRLFERRMLIKSQISGKYTQRLQEQGKWSVYVGWI